MKKKNIILCIASFIIALYLAGIFTNIISPKIQVFIDAARWNENRSLQVFCYGTEYTDLMPMENNKYNCSLSIYSQLFNIEFEFEGDDLKNCVINGANFDDISKISEYTTYNLYTTTHCLKTNVVSPTHNIIFVIMFLFWWTILYYAAVKEIFISKKSAAVFIYSESSYNAIGIRPIIISLIVTLITVLIHYGCDFNPLSESIVLYQKGIDIYQMLSVLNNYKNASLLMWQYEGSLLAGYNLFSYLWYPLLHFFDPMKYHWIQVFGYKIVHIILYNMLVLSVISYLIDHSFINTAKAKKIYYLTIFNPMTYWVAIIFIQFDMLPAYCITLGLLLLSDLKKNKVLSALLLAFGLSAKMPLFLFIPMIALLIFIIILKEWRKCKTDIICFSVIMFMLFAVVLIFPRLLDTPLSNAYSHLAQAERIWYTSIQYAPEVFVFVAIFALICIYIFNISIITLQATTERLILNVLYFIGAVVLVFSFATLSTPSFYIQTIPAFALLYSETDDKLQSLLLAALGSLMVFSYMFAPEGDITATLLFFGRQPIFSEMMDIMQSVGMKTKWVSFLFTISVAAMFSFAMIFMQKAKTILKNKE